MTSAAWAVRDTVWLIWGLYSWPLLPGLWEAQSDWSEVYTRDLCCLGCKRHSLTDLRFIPVDRSWTVRDSLTALRFILWDLRTELSLSLRKCHFCPCCWRLHLLRVSFAHADEEAGQQQQKIISHKTRILLYNAMLVFAYNFQKVIFSRHPLLTRDVLHTAWDSMCNLQTNKFAENNCVSVSTTETRCPV